MTPPSDVRPSRYPASSAARTTKPGTHRSAKRLLTSTAVPTDRKCCLRSLTVACSLLAEGENPLSAHKGYLSIATWGERDITSRRDVRDVRLSLRQHLEKWRCDGQSSGAHAGGQRRGGHGPRPVELHGGRGHRCLDPSGSMERALSVKPGRPLRTGPCPRRLCHRRPERTDARLARRCVG